MEKGKLPGSPAKGVGRGESLEKREETRDAVFQKPL